MGWVKALLARAKAEDVRETRARRAGTPSSDAATPSPTLKRRRMSHTKPELPEYRFSGPKEDHHMVRLKGNQPPRVCTYCSYLAALAKGCGGPALKVSRSRNYCFACSDFLCSDHVDAFHCKEVEDETGTVAI